MRRPSRAPVTAETVENATAKFGRVDTETPAGPRLLRSTEELAGECPRAWIARKRREFGLVAPWDHRTLRLPVAS